MSMLIQPIYEISSSLDLYPFSLSASQCWSDLTAANCVNNPFDTMEDASPNSTKEWTKSLTDKLSACGITIRENDPDEGTCSFRITQNDKNTWFKASFEALKKALNTTSIYYFASDTGIAAQLMNYIDDNGDAYIFFNNCFMTMDRFIRSAEPGTTFYLNKNAVVEAE